MIFLYDMFILLIILLITFFILKFFVDKSMKNLLEKVLKEDKNKNNPQI
ncbi:MAG: hypothetical protein SO136_01205 [Sarcina ventriculi]|uniref:Uncharacterized protein n=1 Tax=Candidatus Sarcina troglodytae TaxID=2726954 RepID=A0ACD1B9V7_9CLOT|nr:MULTISPECIES: hypothetical protein [Sarcina]MDO4401577.1 hypothetical protein [Clostridiaceae bacterium]MBU5323335.1 hypothetical protein [Sarcina ventriculi]MCI5635889.1 hypothetical protein [Sarcina ventriculi]MDD7372574.1 hypothetical protein [Sarcina ventriculi]MDY7061516.1 hypothetical protein [Sarcina ventriculi]